MAAQAKEAEERQYSAFISHSSVDAEKAEAIAASLEAKGLTCWIAPRNVTIGADYAAEIMRGIAGAKCFVLLLSEAANLSPHVRREVENAASLGKPIYPVRLEDVPPSPKLEYFISMHHWLDAWDGVLQNHVDRLAHAMRASEEWIGNKVARRRRLFSGGVATLCAAAAIALAVIFGDDLRKLALSDAERARVELRELGIPFDVDGLSRALSAADAENLDRFARAGIGGGAVQSAFARPDIAEAFFRASKDRPAAIAWFRSALARKLDPNATLPDTYYGQQGILRTALRAGNRPAALALLEAGASPHVFQQLQLTRYARPVAVFPFSHVAELQEFTDAEKAELAAAFVKTGIAFPLPPTPYEYDHKDAQFRIPTKPFTETSELISSRYKVDIPVVTSICEAKPTRICEAATARSGFDWCGFAKELPSKLTAETAYQDFNVIELTQLVNVVRDRAYVLARLPWGYTPGYGLVEIAKDGRTWTVHKYATANVAGMGICKEGRGSGLDWCWRSVQLQRTDDPAVMRMNNYYNFRATYCPR